MTEQRALPTGWKWTRLGDIAELITSGATPKISDSDLYSDEKNGIPFFRIQNIGKNSLILSDLKYVTVNVHNNLLRRSQVQPNDVLITITGRLGTAVCVPFEIKTANINQHICLIRLNQKIANPKYIALYLNSKTIQNEILRKQTGTTRIALNHNSIRSLTVHLPPLPTQRRIVSILEKAEETKRLRAQADELTNQLLQSVFLEMFGDPVKNPKGWKIVRLDDVCEKIQDGTHFSPKEQIGDIPYVTAKNIRPWGIDLTDVTYVPRDIHEAIYRRCDPKKGDVIYIKDGVTAGLAKVNTLNIEFSMLSSIAMIRPKISLLNSHFLEYYLNYPTTYKRIMERKSGSAITRLILREIKDIKIHLPLLHLQEKFAQIVEKVEAMRQTQKQSQQQIDSLFNTFMQKAFKGELTA